MSTRPVMPHTQNPATATAVLPVTLADVKAAAATIRGATMVTECNESRTLGAMLGCRVWLKFENLQFTSTFKERGALNRLNALSADERRRRVIGVCTRTHTQGGGPPLQWHS